MCMRAEHMNELVASLPSLLSHWKSRQQALAEQRRRRELEGAGRLGKVGGNRYMVKWAHQGTEAPTSSFKTK